MKKLLLIILLFAGFKVSAQVYQNPNPGLYGIRYSRLKIDSTLSFPTGNGAPALRSNLIKQAAIYQDSTGHVNYIYDAKAHTWSAIGTGSVTGVSGTSNRIAVTGTTAPIIDIAATYVGQTSLTTLGTITTGTWTATPIGSSYGGAGTINGILKANGSGVVSLAVSGTDYSVKTTITKAGSDVNAAGYIDLSASTVPTFPIIAVYIDGVQATGVMFWNPTNSRLYGFTGSESSGVVIKIIFI